VRRIGLRCDRCGKEATFIVRTPSEKAAALAALDNAMRAHEERCGNRVELVNDIEDEPT